MNYLTRACLIISSILLLTSCSSSSGPTIPVAPTDVAAQVDDGLASIRWTNPSGATSFNIYWSATSGVTKATGTKVTAVSSPYTQSGLSNGTTVYYVVTAENSVGESDISLEVSATPAAISGTDTLYGDQWHLKNTGQLGGTTGEDVNAEPAWSSAVPMKGLGVRIAVVDDGLEIGHQDLSGNVATGKSYNYTNASTDPTPPGSDTTSNHGTAVAGVAAARGYNTVGVRGAAPRAQLVGYNLLQSFTSSNQGNAMTRGQASNQIYSNSWGPVDGNGTLDSPPGAWLTAMQNGITNGRGGLGAIYTWAAGNGASTDNSNYDGYANHRAVIAVGAVTDTGVKAIYSEEGANLWVAAPAGNFCNPGPTITTTDRTGALGYNNATVNADCSPVLDYSNDNYTKGFNGTSSATPLVSGVVALMLQANSSLSWRDVRLILAQTARKNDNADGDWVPLPGGYNHNHKYGFGVPDASAAVTAASAWTNVGAQLSFNSVTSSPNLAIPDDDPTGVTNTISVSGSGITNIEWIEVYFSAADHTWSGDLEVTLENVTTGTVSTLAETHGPPGTPYDGWRFGVARHLGEAANGDWRLTVKDGDPLATGTFQSWRLVFYGT